MTKKLKNLITYLNSLGYTGHVDAEQIDEFIGKLQGDEQDKAMTMLSAAANVGDVGEPHGLTPDDQLSAAELVVEAEEKRVDLISRLGNGMKQYGLTDDIIRLSIAEGDDIKAASKRYREALATYSRSSGHASETKLGEDQRVGHERQALVDGIRLRAGGRVENASDRARVYAGQPVLGMARQYLAACGFGQDVLSAPDTRLAAAMIDPAEMSQLVGGRGMTMLSHSSSDFPNILADAFSKGIMSTYTAREPSWTRWAKRGVASDYKDIRRVMLDFDGTEMKEKNPDGGETKYGTIKDRGEIYQLADRAVIVEITRKVLINDDLSLFEDLPQKFATLSRGYEERAAYDALTSTASMSDGRPFFHADHGNLVAAGDKGPPSVDTFDAAERKLKAQKIFGETYLDVSSAKIVVPNALDVTARTVVTSPVSPGGPTAPPTRCISAMTWSLLSTLTRRALQPGTWLRTTPAPVSPPWRSASWPMSKGRSSPARPTSTPSRGGSRSATPSPLRPSTTRAP